MKYPTVKLHLEHLKFKNNKMKTIYDALESSEDIRLTNGRKWLIRSIDKWEVWILPTGCRKSRLLIRTENEAEAIQALIK